MPVQRGQGAVLQSRRTFSLSVAAFGILVSSKNVRCEDVEEVRVRIRVDESVRQAIPPIAQQSLAIEPDTSDQAKELIERVPPGRAVPILFIIVGAIAVPILVQMIREALRQVYYGGVLIDFRTKPPTITNDPKIPGNMVFTIDRDGKSKQYSGDQLTPTILGELLKAK